MTALSAALLLDTVSQGARNDRLLSARDPERVAQRLACACVPTPVAKVIHSFGRVEQVDRAGLARLIGPISRFLTPEEAAAAAGDAPHLHRWTGTAETGSLGGRDRGFQQRHRAAGTCACPRYSAARAATRGWIGTTTRSPTSTTSSGIR